ncbi:MAG: M48 family metallopeptidase [bacterium]
MNEKKYNRTKLVIDISETIISFVVILLFLSLGYSGLLEKLITGYVSNSYLILILFFGIFGAAFSFISFPIDYYSSYYLEHKYNLSNQTIGKWLIEKMKGSLLGIIIGVPILILFYFLIVTFGNLWWLPFAIGMFLISVVLAQIVPVFIMPLFYKISPLEDEDLKERIVKLSVYAGLKLENVYKFDMSKNTKKANAAFTGLGKTKRILLGDTLLNNFNNDQIETVIAHEMGHYKKKHIIKNLAFSTVVSFGIFYFLSILYNSSLQWFGFENIKQIAALPIIALWGMLIGIIQTPVSNVISRKYEYEADEYAVNQTQKYDEFVTALTKLNEQNLGDKEPHPLVEWYFYSHPSVKKRVEFINKLKNELN